MAAKSIQKMGRAAVLRDYFGTGKGPMIEELRALKEAERDELAKAAAKELGLKAHQCDFPL